jgi:hypothetical protein
VRYHSRQVLQCFLGSSLEITTLIQSVSEFYPFIQSTCLYVNVKILNDQWGVSFICHKKGALTWSEAERQQVLKLG